MRAYLHRDFDSAEDLQPFVDDTTPQDPSEFAFLVTVGGGLNPGDGRITLPTGLAFNGKIVKSSVFDSYEGAKKFVDGVDPKWTPRVWRMWTGSPIMGGQR